MTPLQHMLLDARERTLALVHDLAGEQLLGPRLAIVNPPLWEIGHLGWFQERWCLRRRDDGALAPSLYAMALGVVGAAVLGFFGPNEYVSMVSKKRQKHSGLVVTDDAGAQVKARRFGLCPNAWEQQRVNDRGPVRATYPATCGGNPFTQGMVWGVDQGWAASIADRAPWELVEETADARVVAARHDEPLGRRAVLRGNAVEQRPHRGRADGRPSRRMPVLPDGRPGPAAPLPLQVHGVLREDDPLRLAGPLHTHRSDAGSGLHRPRPPDPLRRAANASLIRITREAVGWDKRHSASP